MELSLYEIFPIIFFHWVFDFVFQTHWQATNKSKNNNALLAHTGTYSACWLVPTLIMFSFVLKQHDFLFQLNVSLIFVTITFIFHTITDYFTSRLNSWLWAKNDVHNFFVSVGFDQVLHYVQLFLTYYLLKLI